MIESTDQLSLPLEQVNPVSGHTKRRRYNSKYPDSPRRGDFPDQASFTRAYQAYFRAQKPDYMKEWVRKPENIERYRPNLVPTDKPPPACHRCGAGKVRGEHGHWICQPCTDAKMERRRKWRENLYSLPAKRDAKRLKRIELDRLAAARREAKAEKDRVRMERQTLLRLKLARPNSLTEGFFLVEDERAAFFKKTVLDGDCLVWTGSPHKLSIAGLSCKPHRLAWFLDNGPIAPGKILAKTCDTKNCINPLHRREEDPPAPRPKIQYTPSFRAVPEMNEEQIKRFQERVNKDGDGCWAWTGKTDPEGYGRFSIFGLQFPAHRVSFFLANGAIDNTLQVHHDCDSPYCVNPAHLSQGDHIKNFADALQRGRMNNMELYQRLAEPDDEEVIEIRRLLRIGVRVVAISKKFGVSEEQIVRIGDV